jgi:hypothetical protein
MEKPVVKEFIEDDGTLINSKMPPNINRMATSKQTTDQHVASSRQGMVWMNYRRFYGETDETLPFTKEADKWENDPASFFKFLKAKGKEKEFNKYFVKKEDKTDVKKTLNEAATGKMRNLIEDIVNKRREEEFVKKSEEDKPTIDQIKEKEPALMKKVTALAESIKSVFTEPERDVIIDYITQIANS